MKRTIILISSILFIVVFVFISNAKTETPAKPESTCIQTICVTVDDEYVDCKVKIYNSFSDQLVAEGETGDDGCVDIELQAGSFCYVRALCGAVSNYYFIACTGSPIVINQ